MYIANVIDVYASRDTPFALISRTYPASTVPPSTTILPRPPCLLLLSRGYVPLNSSVLYIFKGNQQRRLALEKRAGNAGEEKTRLLSLSLSLHALDYALRPRCTCTVTKGAACKRVTVVQARLKEDFLLFGTSSLGYCWHSVYFGSLERKAPCKCYSQ